MKSTPRSPAPIIRFTALPPAPPTPTTFSLAVAVASISSSNMGTSPCAAWAAVGPIRRADRPTSFRATARSIEKIAEPASRIEGLDPVARALGRDEHLSVFLLNGVKHQSDSGREARISDVGAQTPESFRGAEAHGHLEHLLVELHDAGQ